MQYLVDEFEKSLPPMDHPLRKLGVRLTELLDEDQWAECERLLLEGWEHDAADRATGARWRANSNTHEELARLREAAKEAAEHLRNEAAELKKAHTVSGEWDGTEPDAMDECERLIALANRLQTNA